MFYICSLTRNYDYQRRSRIISEGLQRLRYEKPNYRQEHATEDRNPRPYVSQRGV